MPGPQGEYSRFEEGSKILKSHAKNFKLFSVNGEAGVFSLCGERPCLHETLLEAWPTFYRKLLWLGVVPENPEWNKQCRVLYLMYRIMIFPGCFLIAVPYAWYLIAWFGTPNQGILVSLMLTIHASSPTLAWFAIWKYLRSDHCYQVFLPMLKHYELSDEEIALRAKMKHHVLWTAMFVVVYFFFTGSALVNHWSAFSEEGAYGVVKQTVTITLIITFAYRTFTPLALLSMFQMVMILHEKVVDDVLHLREATDIKDMDAQIAHSVSWRTFTQNEWSDKFVVLVTIPVCEMGLFIYALWRETTDISDNYLELVYVVFCVRVALLVLSAASHLTESAYAARFTILQMMITGESNMHGTSMQHGAFMHKIMHGAHGFNIFGFEISKDFVTRAANGAAIVLGPIALNAVSSLEWELHDRYGFFASLNSTIPG